MVKFAYVDKDFQNQEIRNAKIQLDTGNSPPTEVIDDGFTFIDTNADALYIRSGGAWVEIGGDSELYVDIDSNGPLPSNTTINSDNITIGPSTSISGVINAIAIGNTAIVSGSGDNAIALGFSCNAEGFASISLGRDSLTQGLNAIAIGRDANVTSAVGGVGVVQGAIAIGHQAQVINGPESGSTDSIAIGQDSEVEEALQAIALGDNAKVEGGSLGLADFSIAIGRNADVLSATSAIAIGNNSEVEPNANDGIAIGNTAFVDAISAAQIGTGTNNIASSLQFLTNTIANSEGIEAPTSAGAPVTTPSDGSLAVDTTNDLLYFRSSGSWLSASGGAGTDELVGVSANDTTPGYLNGKLVAGTNVTLVENNDGGNETLTINATGGSGGFTVNSETLAATKSLTSGDLIVQALNPDGTARDVVLSDPPSNNDHFVIINNSDGLSANGNTLNIKETAAGPTIQVLDDTSGLLSINAIYHGGTSTWILWS